MEIEHRTFEYSAEDGTVFEGFLALPKERSGPLPGVLVHHAFRGVGEFEKERAKELAKVGFAALAADVYGKGNRGGTFEECFAVMKPFMEDRAVLLKKSLLSSYHALQSLKEVDENRIGAMGYCFGGLCALDLARHKVGLKAAVSFHGTLKPLPDAALDHFDTAIQVHHGDADDHINPFVPAFMQEMRDRKVDWAFSTYGKAVHGFTEPEADKMGKPGLAYNKEADTRSWSAATALFKEKLM